MSATSDVQLALQVRGAPDATSVELHRLHGTAEWADITGGMHDPDVAARDCADLIVAWRREVHLPAGRSLEASRIRARSLALFSAARDWDDVQAFRIDVLGGALLRLDGIRAWVEQRRPPAETWQGLPNLRLPIADMRWTHVAPDSELDRLRLLADELADWFHWGADQAVAFVLADVVPAVSGVRTIEMSSHTGAVIRLDVAPDVPPAVVAERYAQAQQHLLGRSYKSPKQSSFDLVSEWVLRGRRNFSEFAHTWSKAHGVDLDRNACQMAVRRTWRALTGWECPGPSAE